MAWLYQRGKKWWIGYYDEDGKRVRKSISDTKEGAELALKRIEAELERKSAKSITVPKSTLDVIGKQLAPVSREPLLTYPAVRNATHVRELFIRIYDKLGFEVLKSRIHFPIIFCRAMNCRFERTPCCEAVISSARISIIWPVTVLFVGLTIGNLPPFPFWNCLHTTIFGADSLFSRLPTARPFPQV